MLLVTHSASVGFQRHLSINLSKNLGKNQRLRLEHKTGCIGGHASDKLNSEL